MIFLMALQNEEERNKVAQLHHIYYKLMFKIAYDILKDSHSAEDAISESFVRIINNLHKIEDIDSNRTKNFLAIICKHVAIDLYNKREKISPSECLDESLADENAQMKENPENIVITKDTCTQLQTIIGGLDEKYKDILQLRVGYKLSREDIARICGITEEAAKKRLYRARCMIMKEYQKWEGVQNG